MTTECEMCWETITSDHRVVLESYCPSFVMVACSKCAGLYTYMHPQMMIFTRIPIKSGVCAPKPRKARPASAPPDTWNPDRWIE